MRESPRQILTCTAMRASSPFGLSLAMHQCFTGFRFWDPPPAPLFLDHVVHLCIYVSKSFQTSDVDNGRIVCDPFLCGIWKRIFTMFVRGA